MKVAVIFNKKEFDETDVINRFGLVNKEAYNPETVEKVAKALENGGHNVRVIEGNKNVIDALQNFMPRVISGEVHGMVFNMAYGIQGRSRYTHIPAMLEMLGIPYLGSSPSGHAIALDKVLTKIILLRNNLPTPDYRVITGIDDNLSDIDFYPVIVKPRSEAVSIGMKVVYNHDDLKDAVKEMLSEGRQVFIEQFIPGREFAVGVLGNDPFMETLPIVEIDLHGNPNAIQTYDDKTKAPKDKICPAPIDDDLASKLRELTVKTFNFLGLNDFARVDFRVDIAGNVFILEINSMASLGASGSYFHAAKTAGYSYIELVNKMLEVAAIRNFGEEFTPTLNLVSSKNKKSQPIHSKIRSYIRSQMPIIEENLHEMISINSYTNNVESVNLLGNWITEKLNNLGFNRQTFKQNDFGDILYFSNHHSEINDVLLLSHLDTIYDYRDYVPFMIDRGKIIGSGSAESKGGIAIALAAISALKFTRNLKNLKIGFLLATDDIFGGRIAKKLIREFAHNSKIVLGLKYGELNGALLTSNSGALHYQVDFSAYNNNHEITDIMNPLSRKVLSWQKLSDHKKNIQILIKEINAKASAFTLSNHATVRIIAAYNDFLDKESLDKSIKEIANKNNKSKLDVTIKRTLSREPFMKTSSQQLFYEQIADYCKKFELKLSQSHRNYSSNICFVPNEVIAIDGFGPIGGNPRSPNEFIYRDSIPDRALLLSMIIYYAGLNHG